MLGVDMKKELIIADELFFVIPTGFNPVTFCSVVRCSIQLSYGTIQCSLCQIKVVTPTGFKPVTF